MKMFSFMLGVYLGEMILRQSDSLNKTLRLFLQLKDKM